MAMYMGPCAAEKTALAGVRAGVRGFPILGVPASLDAGVVG